MSKNFSRVFSIGNWLCAGDRIEQTCCLDPGAKSSPQPDAVPLTGEPDPLCANFFEKFEIFENTLI